jgi:hypothetical protein
MNIIEDGRRRLNDDDAKIAAKVISGAVMAIHRVILNGAESHPERTLAEGIAADDHLLHAETHIKRYVGGDRKEAHIQHALTRLAMILYQEQEP